MVWSGAEAPDQNLKGDCYELSCIGKSAAGAAALYLPDDRGNTSDFCNGRTGIVPSGRRSVG